MEKLKITLWSVFFLVPTGRGKLNELLSADEFEAVFAKIYSLSKTASFDIKTTEAQHYRRFMLQQRVVERRNGSASSANHEKAEDAIGRAPRGLNDGKGFVFISHTGKIFPSGFMPLSAGAGSIRVQELGIDLSQTRRFSGTCVIRRSLRVSAGRASSRRFAVAHAPVHMHLPEIRMGKSPAAPISRRAMCNRLSRQGKLRHCMFSKALENTIVGG